MTTIMVPDNAGPIHMRYSGFPRLYQDMTRLLGRVSIVSGIPVSMIRDRTKVPSIVVARQAFCWLAHCAAHRSYSDIGRFLGRGHTTIWYAVQKVSRERPRYADVIDGVLGAR